MDFWKVYCLHNSYGTFLIFEAYKKTVKIFFIVVLPLYIKMLTGYYQQNKKIFYKRLVKDIKFLLIRKKTKSANMVENDIKNF